MKLKTIFLKTLLSCDRRDSYSGSCKVLTAVATQILPAVNRLLQRTAVATHILTAVAT
jgi:hypothetical protein